MGNENCIKKKDIKKRYGKKEKEEEYPKGVMALDSYQLAKTKYIHLQIYFVPQPCSLVFHSIRSIYNGQTKSRRSKSTVSRHSDRSFCP